MSTANTDVNREGVLQSVKRLFWSYPEWWCVALSVLAWLVMVQHSVSHWGHEHHHAMTVGAEMGHWLLMIGAMMVPLTLDPLRITAFRSLRVRRHRAMAGFLVGYFALWLVAGLPVVWLHNFPWSHSLTPPAIAFALAVVWVLVPLRQRALVACHRTIPLAPSGWRADVSCVRFGNIVGAACVTSCWPLMAACALTGHSLIAMVAGAAIAALERLSFRPPVRLVFAGHLALAAWYIMLAAR